jgi:hypothetical protein
VTERRFIYLEVHRPAGLQSYPLADRCMIGQAPDCDIVVEDPTVSHIHAALEPYGTTWAIRDLGSRNGTTVNGMRVVSDRVLHDQDEITVGRTRMIFRAPGTIPHTETSVPTPPPDVTRREKEVLVALCRPIWRGDFFTEPASVRGIAKELFVTDAAVKQHLSRLYDKFDIAEGAGERRIRLANAAMQRGAVTTNDLKQDPPPRRDDDEDER